MAVATIIAAIGTAIGSLGFVGTLAANFLISTAMGLALNALSPKANVGATANRGYSIAGESGAAIDHQIIYGRTRVGGVRLYDVTTGDGENLGLHRILAFAGHEIDAYEEIYFNEELITLSGSTVIAPARYVGKASVTRYFGTDTQIADAYLIKQTKYLGGNGWTSKHRLQGIAYLHVEFYYDQDTYPNGVPSVSAKIRGKKVFDPRTSVTAWSENPALCLRDYLTSGFGFNQPSSRIDDDLVKVAANVCDEIIPWNGRKRYTCNGNFTTGLAPNQILSDMLSSMGGLLWYAQGQWHMKAAKYIAPTITLDESDLRSGINLSTRHSRRNNFNTIKGKFRGDQTSWQEADYPEVTSSSFIAADNGVVNTLDLTLPFTTNSDTAQLIANIALRRNREQLTFSASFGLKAFQVQVGDFININNARFGWSNKVFEVTSWTFGLTDSLDLQVQMTLREISSSVFELWDTAYFELNNTTLPDPFFVPDVGLALSDELRIVNEQVFGVLNLDISYSDARVDYVEVEYKQSSSSNYLKLGRVTAGRAEVLGVVDGNYDVRARAVNQLGVRGNWNTILNWYVTPFADLPQDVQGFSANVVGNSLHLTWTPVPDLDLSHYKIRYSNEIAGATYSNGVDVVDKVARPANSVVVPARTGTYFIRAYDKLGNGSAIPTSTIVLTNTSDIDNLNVVATLAEHPTFSGNKTSVALSDFNGVPAIVLDSTSQFDSSLGNFDDALGLFDLGTAVVTSGEYQFSNYIDLGEKYVSRVSIDLVVDRIDYVNTFDTVLIDFDSREGLFDGDATQFDDTSVKTQVSYTDDDPAGTPIWGPWQNFFVGDIAARAMRFKVLLSSSDATATPAITQLTAYIDMPDRIESGNDISFTGSTSVVYPSAFKAVPAIGLSLANLTSGQRYEITSKTVQGFIITIYNSGDTVATNNVTLDYVAKGYGKGI